jgi:hypothetical protein
MTVESLTLRLSDVHHYNSPRGLVINITRDAAAAHDELTCLSDLKELKTVRSGDEGSESTHLAGYS